MDDDIDNIHSADRSAPARVRTTAEIPATLAPPSSAWMGWVSGVRRMLGHKTSSGTPHEHARGTGGATPATPDDAHAELMGNVIDFGRRLARQEMTHRTEIIALDSALPLADNLQEALDGGHTRYPVIADDIDSVIGFVHIKDLVTAAPQDPQGSLRAILREVLLVPETIRGDQLLRKMQRTRQHMAILVDEYGGTTGLVTITDLLEALVGEWPDEFEPREEAWITALGERVWSTDGRLPLADLEEALGYALPCDEECDTVGGYAFWAFGRIPEVGDQVETPAVALRVLAMDGRRVSRLEIAEKPASAAPASGRH